MSILNQPNKIPQAVISNGLVTGNPVQNPDNLLNTTDSTALFGATTDVIIGNFPFSLPLDAVIVGISGTVKARVDSNSTPPGSLTPVLVDDSSGSNVYFPGTPVAGLSNVLQEYSIGGAYDIWGNTWTPTKLNNIKLQLIGNTPIEVAWATLTVYYYIPQTSLIPSPFSLPGCEDCDSEIQALPFELKRVWRTNETVLLLKSFNLPNGTPITLDMLGECGGTINITVDPDLRKEDGGNFIENFNLLDSIASITITDQGVELDIGDILQRGLDFATPYGHNADNISEHAVGAVVIITNNGPYNSKLLKRCHIGTIVSAPITVRDEGTVVAVAVEDFDFIGDSVQAEQDPGNPRKANITVNANPTNVQPSEEDTNTGTNNTTPSLTLTVPLTIVNANYLRVAVITEDEVISGVTYNGVAMTFIGEQVNPGVNLKVALYGLINPTVGAHDAVVTMATPRIITAIVTSWLDVDTTSPTDGVSAGNIGSDNQPTDSVTTTTDNTVVQDVVGTTNNPTTFTQFGLWAIQGAVTTGIRPGASASRRVIAPASVTDIYEISLATDWAILLAGIRGIVAPGVESVTGNYIDNTDPKNPVSQVPLNNTAGTDPTVGDDNTLGYRVDSKWFNSATGVLWTAESVATGAAVWTAIAGGGSGGAPIAGRAYLDTVQSIPSGVTTKVLLDTVDFDQGSGWDIANNKYIAPDDGFYQVNSSAQFDTSLDGGGISVRIFKNGVEVAANLVPTNSANEDVQAAANDILQLSAGDEIEIYVRQDSGSNKDLKGGASGTIVTFLSISKISASSSSAGSTVAARAYKSSGVQSVPGGFVPTLVTLDAETFDTDGDFAGNRFTASVEGYYAVMGSVYYQDVDDTISYIAMLYKNGALYSDANKLGADTGGSDDLVPTVADVIFLNVGDYIELFTGHYSAGAKNVKNVSSGTFLSVALIVANGGGGGASGTELISPVITQVAHGLSVGDIIQSNGVDNEFTQAQGDSPSNSEAVGIVTVVIDPDNFQYVSSAVQLSGAFVPVGTPGEAVWLDPAVPGGMTITKPNTVGQVARGLGTIIASGATMYFDIAALAEEITSDSISGGGENVIAAIAGNTMTGATLPQPVSFGDGNQYNFFDASGGGAPGFVRNVGNNVTTEKLCFTFQVNANEVLLIDALRTWVDSVIGSPGNLRLSIQTTSGGNPTGVIIGEIEFFAVGAPGLQGGSLTGGPIELTAGTYAFVIDRSGAIDAANYWSIGCENFGGVNNAPFVYNTGAWATSNLQPKFRMYMSYDEDSVYLSARTQVGASGRMQSVIVNSGGGTTYPEVTPAILNTCSGWVTDDYSSGDSANVSISGAVAGFSSLPLNPINKYVCTFSNGTIATGTVGTIVGRALLTDTMLIIPA